MFYKIFVFCQNVKIFESITQKVFNEKIFNYCILESSRDKLQEYVMKVGCTIGKNQCDLHITFKRLFEVKSITRSY